MSCHEFSTWIVADESTDRQRAAEHARECPECHRALVAHQALQDRVTFWRQQARAPEHLEAEIRQAIADLSARTIAKDRAAHEAQSSTKVRSGLWLALAASFLVGIGLGIFRLPARSEGPVETRLLLAAADLRIAEAEEKEQVRAILDLEARAVTVLARATEIDLATHQAARLLEYRARIANLDVAIDDVRGFVNQNPGHPRARSMLLQAYKEKKQILREVLALEERSS